VQVNLPLCCYTMFSRIRKLTNAVWI
jgi:hypothetical protein